MTILQNMGWSSENARIRTVGKEKGIPENTTLGHFLNIFKPLYKPSNQFKLQIQERRQSVFISMTGVSRLSWTVTKIKIHQREFSSEGVEGMLLQVSILWGIQLLLFLPFPGRDIVSERMRHIIWDTKNFTQHHRQGDHVVVNLPDNVCTHYCTSTILALLYQHYYTSPILALLYQHYTSTTILALYQHYYTSTTILALALALALALPKGQKSISQIWQHMESPVSHFLLEPQKQVSIHPGSTTVGRRGISWPPQITQRILNLLLVLMVKMGKRQRISL